MSVLKTYSGLYIDLNNIDSEKINIEDIAHALSLVCRGNGHVKSFYSVAQHCIDCAKEASLRGFSNKVVLATLLHDASECYLSDIPSPIKKELPDYKKLEKNLMNVIYTKFLGSILTNEEEEQIHLIDQDMLKFDLHYLLNDKLAKLPNLKYKPSYEFLDFSVVQKEYLNLFNKYSCNLK